ncbi:radical SAM family heme chaperone HemW [Leptospira noguchii]|uniref:Heme chaperone HemW n=2 Tax=Leptospira noguchii TaxID=28182 RepID=M6ULJ8_9LEPT|nr:radical SAM family heme chaperone HemW [Leptospira noguchii]EKR73260.1 putative coproporphyrinogen dehydrogenase [Leptospira noguchii str. 2006001870]EMO41944.1 putative coproporphyrinogen dehydrogenase [Leptospira noguchii serovar Autumnalis str. ZUN142]EMS86231.1 putative coproporphyrinogen dehydrogenase [Leptospira noguchii str. Hook]TQE79012.1 radical SAM family heme chaperone HemW [Leptospira noguchii]UOG31701.1 radical SAM family heme chaperone HemW [Leptospira noguchii]
MIHDSGNPISKVGRPGVYIHYPYCIQKCEYCDFYSVGNGKNQIPDETGLFQRYKEEITTRISDNPFFSDLEFDTIFFGGGTPSRAEVSKISDLIVFLRNNINLSEYSEITIECNPEDITPDFLKSIEQAGINRISVGIQSFDPEKLQFLGRYYDPDRYEKVLETVKNSGISNFSADLIYGIPGQSIQEILRDIQKVLSVGGKHISLYALTVEKGTEYSRKVMDKISLGPEEEIQEKILKLLPDLLSPYELFQYEVSNFSKPGFFSRHNLKYWTMEYYLGIGPGAHGFLPSGRYSNPKNVDTYKRKYFSKEYTKPDFYEELVLSLFRLFQPISMKSFYELIPDQSHILDLRLKKFQESGFCEFSNGIFQWKPEAVLFLDSKILELTSY